MKYLIPLFTILLVASCAQEQVPEKESEVILSGVIENPKEDFVRINYNEKADTAFLDSAGAFKFNLQLEEASYASFYHGREYTKQYLTPGDSLHLSLDTEAFDQTLIYSGDGEHVNNYLAQQLLRQEENRIDMRQLFSLGVDEFQSQLDSIKQSKIALLEEFSSGVFSEQFLHLENARITYDWAMNKMNYPNFHKRLTQNDSLDLGESYDEYLAQLDLNDSLLIGLQEFNNFLTGYITKKASELISSDSTYTKDASGMFRAKMATVYNEFDNPKIKEDMLYTTLSIQLSFSNEGVDEQALEEFKKHCNNEEYLATIQELLDKWEALEVGNPAPVFDGVDIDGNRMALSDFLGTYVYVDVWATWCGPCKYEIPFLEELHDEYKDKNITFISISVDRDKESWEKMVTENEMKGVQLFTEDAFRSTIAEEYNIRGIPRFLLIDPEGNILDANAPRPSGKIRDVFDSFEEEV